MKCKICTAAGVESDFDGVGQVLAHYKSDHPGQRSPQPHKPRGKKRGAGARNPQAPAPTDPLPGMESAAPDPAGDVDDDERTNEIAPEIPAHLEIAPAPPPKRGWRERLGLKPRGADTGVERRPNRYGKREGTADMLAAAWGGLGYAFIRTKIDPATGRCLQYQAPVAGEVLEQLTANTAFDRMVLQPIARNTDNAEAAAALFALPALVFAYQRVPAEAYPALELMMQEAVRAHMKAMVPVIRKRRARERELAKVVDELKTEGLLDPEIGDVQAAVDFVINSMFTEPAAPDEPAAPSSNGAEHDAFA